MEQLCKIFTAGGLLPGLVTLTTPPNVSTDYLASNSLLQFRDQQRRQHQAPRSRKRADRRTPLPPLDDRGTFARRRFDRPTRKGENQRGPFGNLELSTLITGSSPTNLKRASQLCCGCRKFAQKLSMDSCENTVWRVGQKAWQLLKIIVVTEKNRKSCDTRFCSTPSLRVWQSYNLSSVQTLICGAIVRQDFRDW